ncbi:ATP-binding protein [Pontibacillus halophilus JSM 076056 = DSM 19796]|uniref:ATP-binding protein n=1 Tax=Pontibacillus halophilus JSM 076056 = DSM 19796 TaxID=1385510 RepID=A0A0A5GKC9_9BACI|nr:thiol reductant ABC exporter subunit CydC [Pontibacillus halophilus]KGX93741.1 ATP-binding protein [Pontibacillus halophilus JSM 076056 = DSM 19796]
MRKSTWIRPYLFEHRKLLIAVLLLGLLTSFSAAFLMFTSGYLISKAATIPETILMIYIPIVAVRTFSIARAVSRYVERLLGHHTILKILSDMRLRLYQSVEPHVLTMTKKLKTGEVLGLLADDVEQLQNLYLRTIFPVFIGVTLYIVSSVLLGFHSILLAVLMFLYGSVLAIWMPLLSMAKQKSRTYRMKDLRSEQYNRLTEGILGMADWLFSGRKEEWLNDYEAYEGKLGELDLQQRNFERRRTFLAQIVVGVMVVTMLIWTGMEVRTGELSHTMVAAFLLILLPITESLIALSSSLSDIPKYETSVKRLEELDNLKSDGNALLNQRAPIEAIGERFTITFQDVSFQYEESRPLLNQISFHVKHGESVALLGPSGCGKSTILKLLQGAISPNGGLVTINGVSATELYEDYSRYMSFLGQNPYLFDTSILNNLRLSNPEATDDQIYDICKQVQLDDWIRTLPHGYHTNVQESGVRFSGGQRQRIALARVLLQDTPIVVLDEPMVGLDPVTERELMNELKAHLQGKTLIWVTHHLLGVEDAGQILFIDNGVITMQGTHEELLAKEERYQRLYALDAPLVRSTHPSIRAII